MLNDGVEVSGGGLGHDYSTLQFHFHWGDESTHPNGSEHMVDSVRYPMEVMAAPRGEPLRRVYWTVLYS